MLELRIRFESSWTNSFYDEPGGAPLFTSGSDLTGSLKKKLNPVDFDRIGARSSQSRLPFLQALQAANPELLYRVPVSFDRTVQGVLARLVGEVRRLSDVEQTHLALRAFAAGECAFDIEHEHSQTTTLSTYKDNAIQTQGAGLINNEVLYSDNAVSRYLFGHLGQSLWDLQLSIFDLLKPGSDLNGHGWFPSSPSALIDRLTALFPEQTKAIKDAKGPPGKGPYRSPYRAVFLALSCVLPDQAMAALEMQKEFARQGKKASFSIEAGALDGWWIGSAIIIARIKMLTDDERAAFIKAGALTERGNLSGINSTGTVGFVTEKGVYTFASGASAVSSRMPYGINIPVQDATGFTHQVPSGVLKKTGTITFTLKDSPALEQELQTAIEAASVGPFHFGKKGIAYVQSLELY